MNIDIDKIKRKMLIKYPFFGSVIANLKYIKDEGTKTAATDGDNIYYNEAFLSQLKLDEQVFVLAHETCHIIFLHVDRSIGKDPSIWNIACDAVANAFLKIDKLPVLKGSVEIEGAINYNAEELYEKLMQIKQENEKSKSANDDSNSQQENENQEKSNGSGNQSVQSSSSNNIESDDFDINSITPPTNHELWKKALEKANNKTNDTYEVGKKEESNPNKQNTDSKNKDSNGESDNKSDKEKKVKELTKKFANIGEKKAFAQNKIERAKVLEELKKSLAQEASNHGNTTNMEKRDVDNIGSSKPLIDWRRLLRETITYDTDWSYQNATIEDGCVVPHLEDIPKPVTEILLDTSGSIDDELLEQFLFECREILKFTTLKIGCFDTKFYGFTEIKSIEDLENFSIKGGGGTNFIVAVNSFSDRPNNKIIFTDGFALMPEKYLDASWIVFDDYEINPPGGRIYYVNKNYSYFKNPTSR